MYFPRLHWLSLLWRRWHIIPRVFLDLINILHQIDFFEVQPFRPLVKFPEDEQDREDANHGIRKEKGGNAPLSRQKDGVATNKGHDETSTERVPCEVRLEPAFVGQRISRYALCIASLLEADEGEGHYGEIDELRSCDLTNFSEETRP